MAEQEEVKSLSEWRALIKRSGKPVWLQFYATMMGVPVSSHSRFYKSLKMYGDWPLFEAIVTSSGASLKGDPLSYVLKVCANKWKEMQEAEDAETEYAAEIEAIKETSHKQNEEMASKIARVKNAKS